MDEVDRMDMGMEDMGLYQENSQALSQLINGQKLNLLSLNEGPSSSSILSYQPSNDKDRKNKGTVKNLLRRSKSIGHSLLSQRIARKASIQKNIKLLFTPELFRLKTDLLDIEAPLTLRRPRNYANNSREFGITNCSRTQIIAQLKEYKRNLQPNFHSPEPAKTVPNRADFNQTPLSVSRRRCTPKSLLKDLDSYS